MRTKYLQQEVLLVQGLGTNYLLYTQFLFSDAIMTPVPSKAGGGSCAYCLVISKQIKIDHGLGKICMEKQKASSGQYTTTGTTVLAHLLF